MGVLEDKKKVLMKMKMKMRALVVLSVVCAIFLHHGSTSDQRNGLVDDRVDEIINLSRGVTNAESNIEDAGHRQQCKPVRAVKKCKELAHNGREIRFCVYKYLKRCTVMD